MADSSLRSRLNMHGIVDLDQMAAVLTALVDQVDKQNKVIGDLQKSLSLYVRNDVFVERISKLEEVVASIEVNIDDLNDIFTERISIARNLLKTSYEVKDLITKMKEVKK